MLMFLFLFCWPKLKWRKLLISLDPRSACLLGAFKSCWERIGNNVWKLFCTCLFFFFKPLLLLVKILCPNSSGRLSWAVLYFADMWMGGWKHCYCLWNLHVLSLSYLWSPSASESFKPLKYSKVLFYYFKTRGKWLEESSRDSENIPNGNTKQKLW